MYIQAVKDLFKTVVVHNKMECFSYTLRSGVHVSRYLEDLFWAIDKQFWLICIILLLKTVTV